MPVNRLHSTFSRPNTRVHHVADCRLQTDDLQLDPHSRQRRISERLHSCNACIAVLSFKSQRRRRELIRTGRTNTFGTPVCQFSRVLSRRCERISRLNHVGAVGNISQSHDRWRDFTLKSGGDQWRRQDLVSGGARRSRRRRREHRGTKGAEWSEVWGAVSAPQPTTGS